MADKPPTAKPATSEPEEQDGPLIANTTQFPNVLLERFMRVVAPGVWKVICAVVRKTYGWQKKWDAISKSQLCDLTGLSDQGLNEIVALLLRSKILEQGKMLEDSKGRQVGYFYRINIACNLDAALEILTPAERTYKRKSRGRANSVGEGGPTQLGANSVGEGGPTQLDGGANSVGVQNLLLTKPTIQNQGERPLTKSVRLMAQKQFIDSIPPGWRQAEKFAPQSVSNLREFVYNQVRIGAKQTGLEYPDAKLFLADHPLWKDWPDLPLLDAQQEIKFPETVAPKSNKKQLPEMNRGEGHNAWEYILSVLRVSPHSRDTWIKPLRPLGVAGSVLYVRVPTHEFKHVGEKFPALAEIAKERHIETICFVDAETYDI